MKRWTEDELSTIVSNFTMPIYEWKHLLPNRSVRAIATKAYEIGARANRKKKENSPAVRFWTNVKRGAESECWEWQGEISNKGYGAFNVNQKKVRAHRFSWELHHGPIEEGNGYHGTCVLHACDNPACVNPNHLRLGTQAENIADMISKGRGVIGKRIHRLIGKSDEQTTEQNEKVTNRHSSVLSEIQVAEIRKKLNSRQGTLRSIAREYGVSHSTIWLIKTNKMWSNT